MNRISSWALAALFVAGTAAADPVTAPQLEQGVVEGLLLDGTSLTKLGLVLKIARSEQGWSVTLLDVAGETVPRTRLVESLPDDVDAAVAAAVEVTRALLAKPALPVSAEPADSAILDKKLHLARLAQGSPGVGMRWEGGTGLRFVGAVFTGFLPVLGILTTSGETANWTLGLTGSALALAGGLSGLVLDAKNPWSEELPVLGGLAGLGLGAFAASWSEDDVLKEDGSGNIAFERGFRPAMAVAGASLIASAAVLTVQRWDRAHCAYAEQREHLDRTLVATPAELAAAVRGFEQCGVDARARQEDVWVHWLPLFAGALALPALHVAGATDDAGMSLIAGMVLLEGFVMTAFSPDGGPATVFLEKLEEQGLPLEVAVMPVNDGAGLMLHGRF